MPRVTDTNYSPSQRFEAIAYYLGWKGGTHHQVEDAIGVKDWLHRPLDVDGSLPSAKGWFAVRTCSISHRIEVLLPDAKHNWPYWSGVIRGYWDTGALGGADMSERFGNL